jgi:hypothetical protein
MRFTEAGRKVVVWNSGSRISGFGFALFAFQYLFVSAHRRSAWGRLTALFGL